MKKQSLADLLHDLEQEMLRLGYTKGSMTFYRSQWRTLLLFAQKRKQTFYSEQLGLDFLEKHLHIFGKDLKHALTQSEVQKLRIIRMIGDFQLHRTVLLRYYKHKQILTVPSFISISNQFKAYCIDKGYSMVTIDHYVKQSAHFMDYLASQHILDCKKIDLRLIHSYIKILAGYTYKTVEQNIGSCLDSKAILFSFVFVTDRDSVAPITSPLLRSIFTQDPSLHEHYIHFIGNTILLTP